MPAERRDAAQIFEVRGAVATTTGIAPPQRLPDDPRMERRREINRAWKKKQRDGQCEAITKRGTRCLFVGQYDGLIGEVRCGIHAE